MKYRLKPFVYHLIPLLILLAACAPHSKRSIDPSECKEFANFLAGTDVGRFSSIYPLTREPGYQQYREQLNENWCSFQKTNLHEIERWARHAIPQTSSGTVFYPFSGPDILNAMAFFPDAEKYILFGLEPIGELVHPAQLSPAELHAALNGLQDSLCEILKWNFFKTKQMEKEIGKNSFNSIIGIMMFMLARNNYLVNDVRKVWIDSEGIIRYRKELADPERAIPGCEILFNKKLNFNNKRALYFQLNVRNTSLRHKTNFIRYLKKQERFFTIIKAATYLMHYYNHSFTIIRSLILERSELILQDDSGIPLLFFSEQDWNLSFYGTYTRPIPLFGDRFQPNLYRRMRKHSIGRLPFTYGYYINPGGSNLMLAVRRYRSSSSPVATLTNRVR
jgi:hypothetical protein